MRLRLVVLALSLLLIGPARGGETDPVRALRAWLSAKDAAARERALDELARLPLPPAAARARVLREALAVPARPGVVTERLATSEPAPECLLFGPRAGPRAVPTVLSLHGAKGDAHDGLRPFALPDEEWRALRKNIEADLAKRGYDPRKVKVDRPPPLLPWEDGLVVAPSWVDDSGRITLDRAAEVCLAALARANRSGAEPDRTVLAGLSRGGAVSVQVAARHPDRFAGVVSIGGAAPEATLSNLAPLGVFVLHGEKDDVVPVAEGRSLDRRLGEANVAHVYREVKDLGHRWPPAAEGVKLRAWMRERTRAPWPARIAHRFAASTSPRRVFWLELPPGPETAVEATVAGNRIDLSLGGATCAVLHLAPPLVDLDEEVVVTSGERELHRVKVTPGWRELVADLERQGFDASLAAPSRLEVKLSGAPRAP